MKSLYLLALIPFAAFANPIDDNCPQHTTMGAPISSITTNDQYVCHTNYAIHYRYDTKTAEYVVEHLDQTDINGPAKRKDDFRPDDLIPDDKEAHLEDYKGQPYDRGHLVPAADNRTDATQMSESFFLSNMVPQTPNHNRGIWRILELGVRNAALTDDIYVVSGTIYDKDYLVIGNGLGVPTRLWKVVYNATTNQTIAFIFPNAAVRNALYKSGKKVEIMVNYNPKLHFFAEWWKQLYGESEGKEFKGIFPASVDFSSDLHSMGQYIQEGERILFETVLSVENVNNEVLVPSDKADLDKLNFLAGKRVDYINKMAELGTSIAHVDGGVPNIRINIPQLNEFYLGQLIYFFEIACGISGYILDVNPFDQPGVEAYKKNMFALLEKPGFEKETAEIKRRL